MAGPPVNSREDKPDASPRCCAQECCKRRPFFGPPGGKPLFCAQHSKNSEGMVDVSSRRCEHEGCAKWPLYGNEGQKAKFCSMHKGPTMIDVRSRRCAAPDCKRQPSYGFEGSRACFCTAHKEPGMVDVVSRRCEGPHCRRRPLYGFEGQKSQFCSAHKQEGQVDVCNRRCQQQGCSKRPCFGFPGQRPRFCGSHRTPDMVDVISHKCSYPGCSHPTGYEANRVRSKFCEKHKSVGLAGTSLLQLAGSAVDESFPGARPTDSVVHSPGSPSPKKSTSPAKGAKSRAGLEVTAGPSKGKSLGCERTSTENGDKRLREVETTSTQGLTRFAVPREEPESASMPNGRLTHSNAPLPPLGSILEEPPKGSLKRPREVDGKSRSDTQIDESRPESPSVPAEMDFSAAALSVVYESKFADSEKSVDRGGESSSGDGAGGISRCGRSGGTSPAPNVNSEEAQQSLPEVSADSRTLKPCGSAKRLFPGSPRNPLPWGRAWEGKRGIDHAGFLSASLSTEWRSEGLAATGRPISFDEAQAAVSRKVFEPVSEDQRRRASAFVVATDILSPIVTEVGRRESAFEPRPTPPTGWIGHYGDLLSAGQQLRSGLSPSSTFPCNSLNPSSLAEGEGEMSDVGVGAFDGPRGVTSSLWNPSRPTQWLSQSIPENARAERLSASATPSRSARLFHLMSPATPFVGMAGISPSLDRPRLEIFQKQTAPQDTQQHALEKQMAGGGRAVSGTENIVKVDPTGTTGIDRESGVETTPSQRRRRSIVDSPSTSAWGDKHPMREEATVEEGIPTFSGRGISRKQSLCGGGVGFAKAEALHRLPLSQRDLTISASQDGEVTIGDIFHLQRQRCSPLDGASTHDEDTAPTAFVPAWGAPTGDDQNHQTELREDTATIETPAARMGIPGVRRRALLGVDRMGDNRESRGSGAGAILCGVSRHPSSSSLGERETPGALWKRQGWPFIKHNSVSLETGGITNRYVPAWGTAAMENGGQNRAGRND